jgi:hypothetical protein
MTLQTESGVLEGLKSSQLGPIHDLLCTPLY